MLIKKSLLLYCFKADNYYNFERRVKILAKYIGCSRGKLLIEAIFERKYFTYGEILKRRGLK